MGTREEREKGTHVLCSILCFLASESDVVKTDENSWKETLLSVSSHISSNERDVLKSEGVVEHDGFCKAGTSWAEGGRDAGFARDTGEADGSQRDG